MVFHCLFLSVDNKSPVFLQTDLSNDELFFTGAGSPPKGRGKIDCSQGSPPCTLLCQSRPLQLPQPVQGGRERRNVGSCLVFSQSELAETSASLALQSALTAASNGERVVVVVGGDQWSELPSAGHLMPKLSSELMKLIKLVYPSNSKVGRGF